MSTLLQKLFMPAEVQVMLHVYRDEVARLRKVRDAASGPGAGIAAVDADVRADLLKDPVAMSETVRKGDRSPRVLVLQALARIAASHATSGRFHASRGVLAPQGENLRSLVDYCLGELVELKQMSADQKTEWLRDVAQDIKKAG